MKKTRMLQTKSEYTGIRDFFLHAAGLYALFAVAASTLPWVHTPKVSAQAQEKLDSKQFYGTGPGPDRVLLVETPTEALSTRLHMIRQAQHTLDMAYHCVNGGVTTQAILGEIAEAAKRGVKVRILLDGKNGADGDVKQMLSALAASGGVEVRYYNPVRLHTPWNWHALLHDKFIVADNEFVLLGGRNLGDRYFVTDEHVKNMTHDRDVLVWNKGKTEQSCLPQVSQYMDELWSHPASKAAKGKPNAAMVDSLVQAAAGYEQNNPELYTGSLYALCEASLPAAKVTLLANPIHTASKEPWVGYAMQRLALEAEQEVLVQTPYATAGKHLMQVMKQVSGQAKLTYLTNSRASTPNYPGFSNYYSQRQKFYDTGADLWEYQSTQDSIHGKSMVVDNRISAVGSFNLDNRSFYIDTESMLIIDSPEFAQTLTAAIRRYQDKSLLVGADGGYHVPAQAHEAEVSPAKRLGLYLVSMFSRAFQFLI